MQRFLLPFLLIGCAFASSALAQSVTEQPNIIIILADDLGYGDVAFNGCPDYPTPNIDSLTTNGVLCSNGYVTHPFCSPSRAALLTGRYQQRFGHENQPEDDNTNPRLGLPMQELLLPQMLKAAGYACGAVGKWHLGSAPNFRPMQRGFDEFFGFLGGSSGYFDATVLRNNTPLTEPEYLTDAFTREGVSFINRHTAEPFFLYLAYNAPHSPYQAPQSYLDRVANISDPQRRLYAAMVTALDDGVGQVLRALQANNLLDKTMIFFLSDNGAPLASFTRNFPLRGYKFDVLEGGIRVPFVVQWTGRLPAHVTYDQPVSALDIVATAAPAAGVSLPTDRVYDGLNLIPYLTGEQVSPPRTLFWRWFGLGKDGPPGSLDTIYAVRSGSLKLVRERATVGAPELYNLPNDISENQNLALAQPGEVNSLKTLYDQWGTNLVAPLWTVRSAWPTYTMVLAGDWNAFNKGDSTYPWNLTRISAPGVQGTPDGYDWFINTIHVGATGGDTTPGVHSFALVAGNNYSNQWGGATINIDGTTSIPFIPGSALGPTNSIFLQDGFYYSFRLLDWRQQLNSSLKLAVLKTSASPVSVSLNGQTPTTPTSNDSVVVSIATSRPKSVEERIYVRWSTDTFITSHMVEAAGTGEYYSAVIPAQPAGTAVQYCLTTSTVDLSAVRTSGIIDSLTLATSSNFKFVVSSPGALADISTRAFVQTGNNVMIGGFIISGSGAKKVIIRAIGPSLANFGITDPLQNPILELHDGTGAVIATNDNWKDSQQAAIQASGHAPTNDAESAILTTLNPGAYTAIVRGVNGGTGVALIEGYDLDRTVGSKLRNISTRALVRTGDNVMIGGFVVTGPDSENVIVCAIGPSLLSFGIANALLDPTLELHDGNGNLLATNDNWKDTQQAQIQATGHAPSNDAESAIVQTLAPGNYTAIVRGKNNTTGVGLVEAYALQ